MNFDPPDSGLPISPGAGGGSLRLAGADGGGRVRGKVLKKSGDE